MSEITTAETIARLTAERDSAQEHLAYHLRDFRPGVDMGATGDLAVDMAAYAGRLKTERDRLRSGIEALADEFKRRHEDARFTGIYPVDVAVLQTWRTAEAAVRALLSADDEAVVSA